MSDLEAIESVVARAAKRRRWQAAWRGTWQGLLIGAVLLLLIFGVYKLLPIPMISLAGGGVALLAATLAGFLRGWLRPQGLIEAARWMDSRQALKERISTALELSGSDRPDEFRELVVRDAATHARDLDPEALLPFRVPPLSRWILGVLAVTMFLGFVPEFRSKAHLEEQEVTENIKDTGKHLAEIAKRRIDRKPPVLPATQKAMDKVQELGETLQKRKLSRDEALKDLAKIKDAVKERHSDLRKDEGIRRLQEAARQPLGGGQESPEALQKQIEDLQRQLGGRSVEPGAVDGLKAKLENLAQAGAGMDGKGLQGGGNGDMSKLAEALSKLAEEAAGMGLELPDIEKAIEALKRGDVDQFLRDMDAALIDLEKFQKLAQELKRREMSFDMTGKDLPDQLKLGQGIPAIARLQKMARELKSGKMSPQEMKEMMDEVARSIEPGSPYGDVSKHLQKALSEMQADNNLAASESLLDAAKEIEGLLKQGQDCDSLAQMMQALQMAQMCIGNGQGWGQCLGAPMAGMGGKPGRGVGTWSDSSAQMPETANGFWDNSGIDRPDLDPKGPSERDDPGLAGRTQQTKVKGQFAPGAPMPSITLKGLSIKGTSSVEYRQAVSSAQSDAESALNQDRVPRAYRDAVKGYFDNIE